MGWKTSVSEAVIYVMVIGLSVDYVIHLGVGPVTTDPSVRSSGPVVRSVRMGPASHPGQKFVNVLCY